jgi:hypothetical protein
VIGKGVAKNQKKTSWSLATMDFGTTKEFRIRLVGSCADRSDEASGGFCAVR